MVANAMGDASKCGGGNLCCTDPFDENHTGISWFEAAQDKLEWDGVVQSVN